MECNNATVYSNKFIFDHDAFYRCFLLYMRPHEKLAGIKGASFAATILFVLFLPINILFMQALLQNELIFNDSNNIGYLLFAFVYLIFILQIVNGVIMFSGIKRPNVKLKRWNAKVSYSFYKLGTTFRPSPYVDITSGDVPIYMRFKQLVIGFWLGYDRFDVPRFYDEVPYLLPTLKELEVPKGALVPTSVNFQTTVTNDAIIKGNPANKVTFSFDQVYDIFEWKKIPEYAIVRMKNEEDQIIIKKDAFAKGTYEEFASFVRSRITVEEPAVFKKINERIEKRKKKGK